MHDLIRHLTERYETGVTSEPLLERARELIEPGSKPAPDGSAHQKLIHSSAPCNVNVMSFLGEVGILARLHERALCLAIGLREPSRSPSWTDTLGTIQRCGDLAERLAITDPDKQAFLRDVSYWHNRCRKMIGESDVEQRYVTTAEIAEQTGKSTHAFQMWAARNEIDPVGHLREGRTTISIWDRNQVFATVSDHPLQ